jgi:hypothetical protein
MDGKCTFFGSELRKFGAVFVYFGAVFGKNGSGF